MRKQSKKKYLFGVDIGGTTIKIALLDLNGVILDRKVISTHVNKGWKITSAKIVNCVDEIRKKKHLSKRSVLGVGIGLPGQIDPCRGVVYNLINLKGWKNVPIAKYLEKKLGLKVVIDNDVNAVALGEQKCGSAKRFKNVVCIAMGTGIGGGIIINGKLYRGSSFFAGEIGHISIDPHGPKCSCGGFGCVEKLVRDKYYVEPEVMYLKAKRGEKKAIARWNEVGELVGTVLAGVVNFLNPEIVVVGGGVAEAGSFLLSPIRRTVKSMAITEASKRVKIVKAKLGKDAGVVGAAMLILEKGYKN